MPRILALILLVAVVVSAVALGFSREQSRRAYTELEGLHKQRDAANIEWGKLKLEQATAGENSRIEKVARENLGLDYPNSKQVVVVKP